MKINFDKKIHLFYSSVLILVFSVLFFGIYHFWYSGPINVKSISSLFEASLKVDEYKNERSILDIKKMVESDQIGEAIKALDDFEIGIKSIHNVGPVKDSYLSLKTSIIDTRRSLDNLLSLSNLTTLLFVFHDKVAKLEKNALKSNWSSLARAGNKARLKVNPSKLKTPGFFNYKKLTLLSKSMEKDVSYMERIINRSSSGSSRSDRATRDINSLRTELVMMDRYVEKLQEFDQSFKGMADQYKTWIKQAGAEVSFKKIYFNNSSHTLIISLIFLVILMAFAIVSGVIIYRKNSLKSKIDTENLILNVTRKAIISPEMKLSKGFNESFVKEVKKLRKYVHNRLDFSTIFQESLPFSSILLDSDLKLIWANPLFYYQWNLNEDKTDRPLNWDHIKELTSLENDEPILLALNENVAGIYQMKIKGDKKNQPTSLEMFVSPSFSNNIKRIMIFFYPLKPMEENVAEQVQAFASPVVQCLDALSMEKFNAEFQEKIKSKFSHVEMENIYEKFFKHHERIENQKSGLLKEIERLENELLDQYKLTEDLKTSFDNKLKIEKSIISTFKETRDQVVTNLGIRMNMEKKRPEDQFYGQGNTGFKKGTLN